MLTIDRVRLLAKSEIPIEITWDDEQILSFLRTQQMQGSQEAFDLLYLALHSKICEEFRDNIGNGGEGINQRVLDVLGRYEEFPEAVRMAFASDLESGTLTIGSLLPVKEEPAEDVDDIPF